MKSNIPTQQPKILVLHGPNLNLLGLREPEIYGTTTLQQLNDTLGQMGQSAGITVECFQSNHEGELVSKTQELITKTYAFTIVNPAGLTHTSVIWRDALLAVNQPFIEVHLSNIFSRETFRHFSYFSDIAVGIISGLGITGYELALSYAIQYILKKE
jgi:3-dehydroquinate dehydratase-2